MERNEDLAQINSSPTATIMFCAHFPYPEYFRIVYPISCIPYCVSHIMNPVSRIPCPVTLVSYPVSRTLYPVFLCPVSHIPFPFSHIPYFISHIPYPISHFQFLNSVSRNISVHFLYFKHKLPKFAICINPTINNVAICTEVLLKL